MNNGLLATPRGKKPEKSGTGSPVRFEDRLLAALNVQGPPRNSALMLDVSGSMATPLGPNERRIDKLRILVGQFRDQRRFEFSYGCSELTASESPSEPAGGTNMTEAFNCAKREKLTHLVLITDGEPDNADTALEAAKGMKIDVFYVGDDGNQKAKDFLVKLGKVTGGSYGKVSLDQTKALAEKIRLCLPSPGFPVGKGPIAL